jgi:lantibiotic modifying enzyme
MEILDDLSKDIENIHLMDVISGNAGAIPALLEIYDLLKDEKIYNLALSLGMELLKSAIREPAGWSWGNSVNSMGEVYHNLTGFAHGAAGIGYGLLELFKKLISKAPRRSRKSI